MLDLQFVYGTRIAVPFRSFDVPGRQVISKGVDRYGHDSDYVKSKQFTFAVLACSSATVSRLREATALAGSPVHRATSVD